MIKRAIEISDGPAYISVTDDQLIIKRDGREVGRVPLEDLGFIVVDHPAVTYTHRALDAFAENNIALVVCGGNHHPRGMILPFEGHSVHAETLALQSGATDRLKNGLWKKIIKAKIINQASVVGFTGGEGGGIEALAKKVKAGDPENMEARAARRYWPMLFGREFRRGRDGLPPNGLLNYGYAILRAATARALCGAGLHPALGIHHRNRYNAFALADDMMEPLRPMVDTIAHALWQSGSVTVTKECKRAFLELLSLPVRYRGEDSPVMIVLQRSSVGLRDVISGDTKGFDTPIFEDDRRMRR